MNSSVYSHAQPWTEVPWTSAHAVTLVLHQQWSDRHNTSIILLVIEYSFTGIIGCIVLLAVAENQNGREISGLPRPLLISAVPHSEVESAHNR